MADQRFSIVFAGRIADGADPTQVRKNLANLFNVESAKVEPMFSGKKVLLKKNLEETKARNYQAALAKAGAVVELVASDPGAAEPARQAPAASAASSSGPGEPPTPPRVPDLTIAEPGVILVQHEPVPPANFDITGFDLAEVGAFLVEAEPVPPANFDTSALRLEPVGADLTEPRKVEPAQFDTSSLSLADDQ